LAKEIIKKELVFINYTKKEARFFTIEVLGVGYKQVQVITTYGSFNNKGRELINRFEGETAYKDAKKLAYRKMFEKKAEGFIEAADLEKWHSAFDDKRFESHLNTLNLIDNSKTKSASFKKTLKKNKEPIHDNKKNFCDLCGKFIKTDIYNKINDWGRGEGNWDANKEFIAYQKVLCLDCQIEHEIFKKKC
jgi:predicted DNA-binding WGR domain protein